MLKEQMKTYTVGTFAGLQIFIPHNYDEWTKIIQLCAAIGGLVLVLWRIKVDMFNNKRNDRKK